MTKMNVVLCFSITCFSVVFIASLTSNLWPTSLFRGIIGLVVGAGFGLIFHAIWKFVVSTRPEKVTLEEEDSTDRYIDDIIKMEQEFSRTPLTEEPEATAAEEETSYDVQNSEQQ
ncbi:hypothetical protein HXA31_08325 [Salipaludibacillus agaradhaerens]|uniref:Uncharacterized protein n=1 Tax=Salipaludibacillus agaradhaerens TaxID=76935 RepID=A0A9Q4B0E2_SALAG|nr:hypothetical protein [Salipaludibacillus agaradhaerens]MCR6096067.1 hypothetical protein [Salipaludibacillus agaradhaerens]MCR6114374.1 hypothetical protein [Salipaludibacillus agaradhaerens]